MKADPTTTQPARPPLGLRAILPMFVVMTAAAFMITMLFGPKPLLAVIAAGDGAARQCGWGIGIGLAVAVPAWVAILNVRALAPWRDQMLALATRIVLSGFNPLWIGLFAGLGEEALFRGALQPLLGIWGTSLLFTLAHYRTGSFRSMTPTKWGYAALVFLASALLGYVFLARGLIAAAITHSTIDVVGILMLRNQACRRQSS